MKVRSAVMSQCHSRAGGNPVAGPLDFRLRGNDVVRTLRNTVVDNAF
jgi:hypothetical protein